MNEQNKKNKSDVFTKKDVVQYNWKLTLRGLRFLHSKTISLVKLEKEEGVIVEVGSGTGLILRRLRSIYPKAKLLGIDASADMVKFAKANSDSSIEYKMAYASDLPVVGDSTDFSVSVLSAHHMDEEEKKELVREMKRITKSGGYILISDFGRANTWYGKMLAFLSSSHSHTKNNFEVIDKSIEENKLEIVSRHVQFGYIEHLLARKA